MKKDLLGFFLTVVLLHSLVFADSTAVNLPNITQLMHPEPTTVSQNTYNENYTVGYGANQIWPCPGQPGAPPALDRSTCPTINNPIVGADHGCPDVCAVIRQVATNSFGNISGTVGASCPPGYVLINVNTADKEIKYTLHPPPAPSPIDNATYQNYVAAGYTCSATGSSDTSPRYCRDDPGFSAGQITANIWGANNNVAQVTYVNSQCYSRPNCASGVSCNVAHNRGYDISYTYMVCTPPPGLFYANTITGQAFNNIPTVGVCARTKAIWLGITPSSQ